MALTRRALKAMGIDEEKIEEIIAMHTETVDGLKAEVKKYKSDAEALPEVQKQLDKAREDLESERKDSWKVKYDAVKEEFDTYKNEQKQKESRAAKEKAYRELLKKAGISEKRLESVLRVSDIDSLKLDEEGRITDEKDRIASVKEEWADFIVSTTKKGAATANPPANTGGSTMTREQIMQIKDRGERRAAIAANLKLFDSKGEGTNGGNESD